MSIPPPAPALPPVLRIFSTQIAYALLPSRLFSRVYRGRMGHPAHGFDETPITDELGTLLPRIRAPGT